MSSVKKITHILILIFIAYIFVKISPTIEQFSLLEGESLLTLNLVILGIGVALIAFLRGIYKSYSEKIKKHEEHFELSKLLSTVVYCINLNIKRMMIALLAILVIYISQNSQIILIQFNSEKSLNTFNTTFKLSIVFYLLASIFDIIISTLKLYEAEFKNR